MQVKTRFGRVIARMNRHRLAGVASLATVFTIASAGIASAAGTATYDITPVTSGFQNDISANLPVILGGVGALIAIGVAVRWVRKFFH